MVEAFISMWPRELCDIRQKGQLFIRTRPELRKSGVYVLYRDDQPYYIGKAGVLQKRLRDHVNHPGDRYHNFWNLFSAYVVRSASYLNEVESILIAAMPTAQNSSKPRMTKIRMPAGVSSQIQRIRKHQAEPITRREFANLLKISRKLLQTSKRRAKAA